jgi:D-alanyl-D-alanine carboxypeptidase
MEIENDSNEKIPEYQQFLKEKKNGNIEKAKSEENNNNIPINDTTNNFKTEIENSYLDKKRIQFGFENEKTSDEKYTVEEDTKAETEEQIEEYQMSDEDKTDFYNDFDIATVEVNSGTQKSYQLSENQKSEFSENNSK